MATRKDTRSFSSTTTDTFAKMGDNGMGDVVNTSGQRSAYTMPVASKDGKGSAVGGEGTAGGRGSRLRSTEQNGPAFQIKATRMCSPADPRVSEATGRAIRTMSPAMGRSAFWDQRQDGERIA